MTVEQKVSGVVITSSPRPMTEGRQGEMQARGRRVDGQSVGRPDVCLEFRFELRRLGTGRQPAGAQRGHNFVDFFVFDGGKIVGNELVHRESLSPRRARAHHRPSAGCRAS